MGYINKVKNSANSFSKKIEAHYKVIALDEKVASEFAKKLETLDIKDRQKALDKYVEEEGITGEDLLDLMYDLNKLGYNALKKPVVTPMEKHGNPIIVKLKAGHIDKQLGTMLQDANLEDAQYKEAVEFLKKNPAIYGDFISKAEKNKIGFYEKDFHIPITKAALEKVDDDYLINSILHTSVYTNDKQITNDAIEYAFNRFQNPFKKQLDTFKDGGLFSMAADHFQQKSPSMKNKMKAWYKALDAKDQDSIKDAWGDHFDDPIEDYLNS
jgi:hypothetical protein